MLYPIETSCKLENNTITHTIIIVIINNVQ